METSFLPLASLLGSAGTVAPATVLAMLLAVTWILATSSMLTFHRAPPR